MSRLFVTLQYLLPHHLLCRLIYWLTRIKLPPIKNLLIRVFVRLYRPRMSDAAEPDPLRYDSFNAFFTRALKLDARPIDPEPRRIVSPCDGTLSVAGTLDADRILQAKGHDYTLGALLAAQPDLGASLQGGLYATIYLAPYNYHRLHMPLPGRLRAAWHVPGRLFSVNAATVARVPALFARNERVVCVLDGELGQFVLVLVGALFVGGISTVWHGEVTPWHPRRPASSLEQRIQRLAPIEDAQPWQPRGAEFARFNMGSTLVMLFPPGMVEWDAALHPGMRVAVGQGLGST